MKAFVDLKAFFIERIARGGVDSELINALQDSEGKLVPRESELWDYKISIGTERADLAELVRDIVAFHNSFGGYLIVGIADDGSICGCEDISEQTIRNLIRAYSTTDIGIAIQRHTVSHKSVAVIFVPKRMASDVPVAISKIGPEVKNRPIFKPGDIFFRANDSSQLLRGSDDLRFLMGVRRHSADQAVRQTSIRITPNNLPDRTIVFNKFFGRDEIKDALWTWLADPMSRYRVIAGPGGFGKTSAAYSFCEEVCSETPLGLEQVVWLSAKRFQFDAVQNRSNQLPYKRDYRSWGEAYESFDTLLDALSHHLPIADDEWEGYDHGYKIRKISEALAIYPSLVVVDDLDSLTPDDQRLAIELAMGLRQMNSRFLFTTRKNFLAPAASTSEIKGLQGKEFEDFVAYLQEIYSRKLSSSELKALAHDTEGSPMFTESIFRLLRLGARFSDALARWKGSDGEAVRSACFRREIEQLEWASKKILFAVSMFETVSTAEIRQMAELETSEVEAGLNELDRLFLVQSKQIAGQSRFGIAPNLRRQLQEVKADLVPNHGEISLRASKLRSNTKEGMHRGRSKEIAEAIQQAMAQLGEGDYSAAIATIESTIAQKGDSADLWMVYARCLTNITPMDVQKVRTAFQKSYNLGKREPQLFTKWIEFELEFGNSNAAIDVGEKGDAVMGKANWEWLAQRAASYSVRGRERETRIEVTDAMSDLQMASTFLYKAIKQAPGSARASITTAAQQLHDSMWRISTQSSQFNLSQKYEAVQRAVLAGDKRISCVSRMIDVISTGAREPVFAAKNPGQLQRWMQEVQDIVEKRNIEVLSEKLSGLRAMLMSN